MAQPKPGLNIWEKKKVNLLTVNLSLADRASHFQEIISRCEIIRRNGGRVDIEDGIAELMEMLLLLREEGRCLYVVGNGGSASVASHAVIDFLHVAGIRAFTLHDASVITCMANDYGYDRAFGDILSKVARAGDMLIAISSSGASENICNACRRMRECNGQVVTLSGFSADNPLRTLGDINLWLDSSDYGFVEVGHQFVLHNIVDRFSKA